MTELQTNLPPGWGCEVDSRTGKYYYVNHYTKTTTWDDPRMRHRPLQGTPKHLTHIPMEHISLQHGSPVLGRNYVYPSHSPPIQAFQMSSVVQNLKSTPHRSPLQLRSAKVQDSSFSTATTIIASDPEDSVAKISALFPTASETHIKLLLKKYMKSLFPNADETIILEVLQNNDANIQKTSENLKEMGYSKKESAKSSTPKVDAKSDKKKRDEEENKKKKEMQVEQNVVKIKTTAEKDQIKKDLQEKYKDVAEHLINIALESVHFNENRANQILQIMIQEDTEAENNNNKNKKNEKDVGKVVISSNQNQNLQMPVSQSRQSIKSILKSQNERKDETAGFSRILDDIDGKLKSTNLCNTVGHDNSLSKGPNEKLLLENYVQWQGPKSNFRKGTQGLAKGPNKSLLSTKIYTACGPNSELRKGPKMGLAKGSIFSQMKAVVAGENRVK